MLSKLLNKARKGGKPDGDLIQTLSEKINFSIDSEWWDFISNYDGAYIDFNRVDLALWTVENIVNMNPYFEQNPESDNYLFFGDNGSSTGFAFDKIKGGIVAIDHYNFGEEEPIYMGDTFEMFLDKLSKEPPYM